MNRVVEVAEITGYVVDPEQRKQLLEKMLDEDKSDLMRQLTGILWQKSKTEIAGLILSELSEAERLSMQESYGIE